MYLVKLYSKLTIWLEFHKFLLKQIFFNKFLGFFQEFWLKLTLPVAVFCPKSKFMSFIIFFAWITYVLLEILWETTIARPKLTQKRRWNGPKHAREMSITFPKRPTQFKQKLWKFKYRFRTSSGLCKSQKQTVSCCGVLLIQRFCIILAKKNHDSKYWYISKWLNSLLILIQKYCILIEVFWALHDIFYSAHYKMHVNPL